MVFFISTTELKDNSYINNNVDDEQLRIIISRVQNVNIASLLGQKFFDSLFLKYQIQLQLQKKMN